jgi:hypothetical protein
MPESSLGIVSFLAPMPQKEDKSSEGHSWTYTSSWIMWTIELFKSCEYDKIQDVCSYDTS